MAWAGSLCAETVTAQSCIKQPLRMGLSQWGAQVPDYSFKRTAVTACSIPTPLAVAAAQLRR